MKMIATLVDTLPPHATASARRLLSVLAMVKERKLPVLELRRMDRRNSRGGEPLDSVATVGHTSPRCVLLLKPRQCSPLRCRRQLQRSGMTSVGRKTATLHHQLALPHSAWRDQLCCDLRRGVSTADKRHLSVSRT